VDTLQSWLTSHPGDVPVMTELANALRASNQTQRYEDQLREILKVHPTNVYALNNLGWVLMDRSPAEAVSYARAALEQDPAATAVMDTLALAYSRNNEPDNALRFVSKAIDGDPGVEIYRLHRAEIRMKAGDAEGAMADLLDLIQRGPPEPIRSEAETLLKQLEDRG
jgi:Tfp pilus assembly protein PilF